MVQHEEVVAGTRASSAPANLAWPIFLHLERGDPPILGESGLACADVGTVPVARDGFDLEERRVDDEVGLPDIPRVDIAELARRRQSGQIAPRGTSIDPLPDRRNLL